VSPTRRVNAFTLRARDTAAHAAANPTNDSPGGTPCRIARFGPGLGGALGLVLALAACAGQSTPPPQGFTSVTGSVTGSTEGDPALGAALLLGTGPELVKKGSVVEVYEGFWLAGATLVDDDGGFQVQLPDGDDLPASLLVPASDLVFLPFASFDEPCVLDTSNATTNVTAATLVEVFALPGIAMLTASGAALSIATPVEVDLEGATTLFDIELLTWVHADGAVDVATPSGGCVETDGDDTIAFIVDVALDAGWNQLAWSFDLEEVGLGEALTVTLRNDDAAPVFVGATGLYLNDLVAPPF
jgi:hypothetical protein